MHKDRQTLPNVCWLVMFTRADLQCRYFPEGNTACCAFNTIARSILQSAHFSFNQQQPAGHGRIETLLTQPHTHPRSHSSLIHQETAVSWPQSILSCSAQCREGRCFLPRRPASPCATLGKELSSQRPGDRRPPRPRQSVGQSGSWPTLTESHDVAVAWQRLGLPCGKTKSTA